MITPTFTPNNADVVFVGGGPVALWTAIQTKMQSPNSNIVVLEKYSEYKRVHNLFIDSASLATECTSESFDELVTKLKSHKVISTSLLETTLAELAEKVGVVVQKNVEIINPKLDLAPFTNAKVIVGADGAHSIMRQYIVGDVAENCFNSRADLHYIADLTYTEAKEPVGMLAKMTINSHVGNAIHEIHSKKSQKTTLRTFITAEDYSMMKHATRKNPENINSEKVAEAVRKEYLTFLKSKYGDELYDCIDIEAATVTTTTLGYYVSKKMVKHEEGRTWCLVGDAAFGVPFFRSLNNGLVSGTELAKVIANIFNSNDLYENNKFVRNTSSFKGQYSFVKYEAYMQNFASWQVKAARIKSFGVNAWIRIAKMFQGVSGPNEYLKSAW
ncbi:MAG TPA: hypothetical protein VGP47_01465 [Parachlamydiaceae bacterium]|nr:hypothetical protein [Parachlamydiaceae bacterium]